MTTRADVLVIGGGISGAAAAYELAAHFITRGELPDDIKEMGVKAADISPTRLR